MSASRPSFRQKWLLPMATLTGAALVVFWAFYALDHLIAATFGLWDLVLPASRRFKRS